MRFVVWTIRAVSHDEISDHFSFIHSVPGINAQARRLQRIRAKGTPALTSEAAQSSPPTCLRRTVSETSLSPAPTLPEAAQSPEEPSPDTMRYSLYQCPHLLLLQGYSQQHVSHSWSPVPLPLAAQGLGGQASPYLQQRQLWDLPSGWEDAVEVGGGAQGGEQLDKDCH